MRAVVLIEWGPLRWQKALVAPGEKLVVGRHEKAGLVVPHDEELSGLHFELTWTGTQGHVRDLGSLGGIELDGESVQEGEVEHGAFIQAGATVFSVYQEGVVPRYRLPKGVTPIDADQRAKVLAALRAEKAPLYAVLDAARRRRILALLRSSVAPVRPLYDGVEGEELEDVSPYLVSLSGDPWLLERLVEEGWGDGWGIFLTSRARLNDLRRQLKRMLLVQIRESGEQYYFRFYEPRALRAALAQGGARTKQQLFGDVEAFLLEGGEGESGVEVWRREGG
jgi:pSer/pThr/pTyr-binding forkhead associated (FHA) protein